MQETPSITYTSFSLKRSYNNKKYTWSICHIYFLSVYKQVCTYRQLLTRTSCTEWRCCSGAQAKIGAKNEYSQNIRLARVKVSISHHLRCVQSLCPHSAIIGSLIVQLQADKYRCWVLSLPSVTKFSWSSLTTQWLKLHPLLNAHLLKRMRDSTQRAAAYTNSSHSLRSSES